MIIIIFYRKSIDKGKGKEREIIDKGKGKEREIDNGKGKGKEREIDNGKGKEPEINKGKGKERESEIQIKSIEDDSYKAGFEGPIPSWMNV